MFAWNIVFGLAVILFGFIVWIVYKDIKYTVKKKLRLRKVKVYGIIFAFMLALLIGLRLFAAEPLSNLYYLLGGGPLN